MTRLIGVEWFKLRKRMMTWVVALVLVGFVVLLYSVLWSVSGRAASLSGFRRFEAEELRRALFIGNSIPFSLQIVGTFGAILAVVFAAGAVGSEYSWGTIRLMGTKSSGRLRFLAAKLIVVSVLVVVGSLLAVAVGLAYSYFITQSSGGTSWDFLTQTFVIDQLKALGRTLYVLAPYVSMAFALAVIGRSTLAGVGTGIGVAFIGPFVSGLMQQGGSPWNSVPKYLINTNASVLLAQNQADRSLPTFGPDARDLAQQNLFSPETAYLVLGVYILVFLALAFAVYRRRDITATS